MPAEFNKISIFRLALFLYAKMLCEKSVFAYSQGMLDCMSFFKRSDAFEGRIFYSLDSKNRAMPILANPVSFYCSPMLRLIHLT